MAMKTFLIYCSGANKEILNECPSEITKFSCIGGTVLFTSIFAFIASSYAFYSTFSEYDNSLYYSYLFGVLWALMIFNLDRYILCSIKKSQNKIYEFFLVLPRLFIAVLIAITIAKPLEIKLLENKIIRQIYENNIKSTNNDIIDSKKDLQKATNEIEKYDELLHKNLVKQNKIPDHIETLNKTYQECEKDYKQSYSEYYKKRQQLKIERSDLLDQYYKILSDIRLLESNILSQKKIISDNPSLTNEKIKAITELKRLENELSILKEKETITKNSRWRKYNLLKELQSAIADKKRLCNNFKKNLKSKIKKYQDNLQKELDLIHAKKRICIDKLNQYKESLDTVKARSESINKIAYAHTFITQLEALGDLTSVKYSTMWCVQVMIMILFITIETTPVLLRFMSSDGPYDRLFKSENESEIHSFLSKKDYTNKIEKLQYEESFKQQSKTIRNYYQILIDENYNLINNYFKKLHDFRLQKLDDIFKSWDESKTYEYIEKEFMRIYSGLHVNFLHFINEILKNNNANNQDEKSRVDKSETQEYSNDEVKKNSFIIFMNICLIIFTVMCILCLLMLLYSRAPTKFANIATIISIFFAGIGSLTSIANWLDFSIFKKAKRN